MGVRIRFAVVEIEGGFWLGFFGSGLRHEIWRSAHCGQGQETRGAQEADYQIVTVASRSYDTLCYLVALRQY
jgi:hypothetical protein